MKTVTLVFPAIKLLWSFIDQIDVKYTEVNIRTISLICDCSEADLVLAIRDFKASVVDQTQDELKSVNK